jgi:hypothetical protein
MSKTQRSRHEVIRAWNKSLSKVDDFYAKTIKLFVHDETTAEQLAVAIEGLKELHALHDTVYESIIQKYGNPYLTIRTPRNYTPPRSIT